MVTFNSVDYKLKSLLIQAAVTLTASGGFSGYIGQLCHKRHLPFLSAVTQESGTFHHEWEDEEWNA